MLRLLTGLRRAGAVGWGDLPGLAQLSHGLEAHIGPAAPWGCSSQCLWTLAGGAHAQGPSIGGRGGVAAHGAAAAAAPGRPAGALALQLVQSAAAWRGYAQDHKTRPWQQRGPPPPPPKQQQRQQQPRAALKRPRRNEEIRAGEVRAIFPDGTNQVLPLPEALRAARALGLDLVEVPGTRDPLVAKVLDWEKFAAQQRKDEEEAERKERLRQKLATPKEVQFTARIGDNDLEIKLRKVNEFLEDGLKVNLVVKHRRDEGEAASTPALDYLLERLRAERPGLEAGVRSAGGRSVNVVVWLPQAAKRP
ncbi:translation initiation factor IF-3 [Raphidocelis subcapitata]|uniref:Translation initiation factor IF-3 n=1 Tax=Raphidocelis subcapitata TaxID=307507 RepID=A0A2V0P615_9CHLO|nr:translation initiation factor IF-3 [Raphidocelis subcapitata]|eukprot:GBF94372.1 translation initiation factor IF-3 [Raphidocelis subcapitata]